MILNSSADSLRLTTTSAATLNVICSYSEGGLVGPSVRTIISSATTTSILGGSLTLKSVKSVVVTNTHASLSNTVTLALFNGATSFQVFKVVLASGESFTYFENSGFTYLNAQGMPKISQSQGSSSPATSAVSLVILNTDVVNNNAVANTLQNVTGLSFPVVAGETYWFEIYIDYTAALATTGSRWTLNGPSFTRLSYMSQWSLTATSFSFYSNVAYQTPAASNVTSASTVGNTALLGGFVTPSVSGDIQVQFASEVLNSAITAKAGSVIRYARVL